MRDKLIELLDETFEKQYDRNLVIAARPTADYLISHGVTFADVPDTNVGKWIPVSERLPDKSGKYLVRCELWGWGKLFNQWTGLCFFWDETRQFIDDGGPVMGKVTHWMPLPEPPKEGE